MRKLIKQVKEYGSTEDYVISYLKMRRMIGIFGFGLPLVLIIGSYIPGGLNTLLPSISKYYDTYMRDIFVGVLCGVALFLFSYKGFSKVDNLAANAAALFALGVAFLPTSSPCRLIHVAHLTSAALFFVTLACISLFLFTLTKDDEKAMGRKKIRNRIYRICGYTMLGSMLLLFVYICFLEKRFPQLSVFKPIFILETIALFAFGTSWLIKGRTLWGDK